LGQKTADDRPHESVKKKWDAKSGHTHCVRKTRVHLELLKLQRGEK